MAEFASKTGEAKFSVDVWRCIITFCTRKLPNLINRLAANDDQTKLDCFEFLLSAIKTGCSCIRYDLENICEVKCKNISDNPKTRNLTFRSHHRIERKSYTANHWPLQRQFSNDWLPPTHMTNSRDTISFWKHCYIG